MIQKIKNTKTGKLINLIDENTGNALTGDSWRAALDARDALNTTIQSMNQALRMMEIKRDFLAETISATEKRWADVDDS